MVREVRNRSVRYGFEFRRAESHEVVAIGEAVAVHAELDPSLGRLAAAPIPAELRSVLFARLPA